MGNNKLYYSILTILLLTTSSIPSHIRADTGNWTFSDDFESGTIKNRGIQPYGDTGNTAVASLSSDRAFSGNMSLKLETSVKSGVSNFFWEMNLNYSQNKFFSFLVFCEHDTKIQVRMELTDKDGQYLALDFGRLDSGWEPDPIYNTQIDFKTNAWTNPHIDLDALIAKAISVSSSPYTTYIPTKIMDFFFFNDNSGTSTDYIDLFQFNTTEPIWPQIVTSSPSLDSSSTSNTNSTEPTINLNVGYPISIMPLGLLMILALRVLVHEKRKS